MLRLEAERRSQHGHAAARENSLFDGRTGRVQRVLDAGLLLLHFALGRRPDVDLGHAARQLGDPLFELFAIVIAGGRRELVANLIDAGLEVGRLAGPFDDRRVVLVDDDLLRPAQVRQLDVLELDTQVLEDRLAADHDGDVLQHGLAAVAVARRLHAADLERAAKLVDDQRRQSLAFDFLGNDQAAACPRRRPSPGPGRGP